MSAEARRAGVRAAVRFFMIERLGREPEEAAVERKIDQVLASTDAAAAPGERPAERRRRERADGMRKLRELADHGKLDCHAVGRVALELARRDPHEAMRIERNLRRWWRKEIRTCPEIIKNQE